MTETIARLRGMLETGKAHESQLFACSASDAESLIDAAERLAAVEAERSKLIAENERLRAELLDSDTRLGAAWRELLEYRGCEKGATDGV